MMENELKQIIDEAAGDPKISGYLCADSKGLCLAVAGDVNEKSSGIIAEIASLANRLDVGKSPVVYVESDKSKILIQCKDSITTALYKTT